MNHTLKLAFLPCLGVIIGCQDSQPDAATYDLPQLVTQLTAKTQDSLIYIEGGTFIMGDVKDQNGDPFYSDSDYSHIENGFLLGLAYLF